MLIFSYIYYVNYEAIIAEKDAQIASLTKNFQERILTLQDQLYQLTKLIYGRKSERFISTPAGQFNLFTSVLEQTQTTEIESKEEEKVIVPEHVRKRKNHKGRQLLASCRHLPVEEQIIDVEHDETHIKIGEAITEKIGYKPGRLFIKRIIRTKYKNPETGQINIAPLPSEPIQRCEADTSLLSYVTTSKFVDHLPENRLQAIFKRDGVIIPPSTMNGWTHDSAHLAALMATHINKELLQCSYLQMDESTIRVVGTKKNKSHLGYMWVINSPEKGLVAFKYFPGRGGGIPIELLKDFEGFVQADGYSAYDQMDARLALIILIHCMAHARRKFEEALQSNRSKASEMLKMMQVLYGIEREIRESGNTDPIYIKAKRKKAKPTINKMYLWLRKEKDDVTNVGSLLKAINYTWKRWAKLCCYVNNGILQIDNNLVENAIRPLALGRKNYLFAGSHEAAENYAVYYTIFGTCKKLGVNPYDYMKWFLDNVSETSIQDMEKISPMAYKKIFGTMDT